jgi:hypothetical protein
MSTENDHRHHHKFIKYEKRLRKEGCALFRNNKQHVVLGQKRNCQRMEESGL